MDSKKAISSYPEGISGILKRALVALIFFLLMGLPSLVSPLNVDFKVLIESISKTDGKTNPCIAISAKAVLQRLHRRIPIILVDVRDSKEFKRASIPGAINIPLHSVKTKAFLKAKPVVLVDGGYPDSQMEAECKRLQNNGFNVAILRGGLLAWHRLGGLMQGDLLFLNQYKTISPLTFYQSKDRPNQIIVNASEEIDQESIKIIPNAVHIPIAAHPEKAVAQLKQTVSDHRSSSWPTVLVFNQNGANYQQIETIMKTAGLEDVFFLTGGFNGYQRFLRHLALSRQSRDSRMKTTSQCPSCGPQKEKE